MKHLLASSIMVLVTVAGAFAQSDDSELVLAARNRDSATVRSLLDGGANVNHADAETMTALHWAAHWSDLEMVRMLLDAGADATVINRYGVTPLHEASTVGNIGILEALLDSGADPNSGYGAGETALMTAARTGIVATVRLLLDRGGNPNASEEWRGQTALMWAAVENHPDVAQLLIERGAEVDARSTFFDFESLEQGAGGAIVDRPMGGLTALIFAGRSGAIEVGDVLGRGGGRPERDRSPVRFYGDPNGDCERSLGFRGADDRAWRRCQRRFPVFLCRNPQYSRKHQPARPAGPGRKYSAAPTSSRCFSPGAPTRIRYSRRDIPHARPRAMSTSRPDRRRCTGLCVRRTWIRFGCLWSTEAIRAWH